MARRLFYRFLFSFFRDLCLNGALHSLLCLDGWMDGWVGKDSLVLSEWSEVLTDIPYLGIYCAFDAIDSLAALLLASESSGWSLLHRSRYNSIELFQ